MARGGRRPGSGRKPKPREVHEAQGTLRPDRHGKKPALRVNRERPPMPGGLDERAKVIWKILIADLESNGVLARSDALAIEATAVLIGRARAARTHTNRAFKRDDPGKARLWWRIEKEAWAQARMYAEQLGLSPSARQKLGMQVWRSQGGPDEAAEPAQPAASSAKTDIGPSPRLHAVK